MQLLPLRRDEVLGRSVVWRGLRKVLPRGLERRIEVVTGNLLIALAWLVRPIGMGVWVLC